LVGDNATKGIFIFRIQYRDKLKGISVKKLPVLTKIVYGFGDIGFSMTSIIVAAYFPIFLTDVVGIAPPWMTL
jgi:hypothetical protein